MKIPKQVRIDRGQMGGLYSSITQTLMLASLINFINITIMAYQTNWYRYVNEWQYVSVIVGTLLSGMVFVYVILQPSNQQFASNQWWTHNNPLRPKIEKMEDDLEEIKGILKGK